MISMKDPRHESLASQTTLAAVCSGVVLVVNRSTALINQLVLAAFLVPADLGAVAFATSLSLIGDMMQSNGIGEVLLRRKKPGIWFSNATAMSVVFAAASVLAVVVAALVIGLVYENMLVCTLMLVNCARYPVRALAVVPLCTLSRAFRFREISIVNSSAVISAMVLTIVMATLGCGAYSIVVPWVVSEVIKAVCFYTLADLKWGWRLRLARWRYLLSGNIKVMGGNIALQATQNMDYLFLGVLYSDVVLGLYFFAFNLSTQVAQTASALITDNVQITLSSVANDRSRQYRGFIRACRIIIAIGMPLCVLQCVLAAELIQLLFHSRWEGSIHFLRILSCAMGFRLISVTCVRFLVSQGRYGTFMGTAICTSILFFVMLVVGAMSSENGTGIAVATACYSIVLSFIYLYVSLPPLEKRTFIPVAQSLFAIPTLASFLTIPCAKWLVDASIPDTSHNAFATIVATTLLGGSLYLLLFRSLIPEVWIDISTQLRRLHSHRVWASSR